MRSLIPWRRDGGVLDPLQFEMEDLFHRFLEPFQATGAAFQAWAPRVDVEETDKEIVVKADLPGVDPKDVDISVVGGSLVLKGEKKEERAEKKKGYHRIERFGGQFYREIPIPAETDPDKIAATSCKGVITITIPKKPEAQPKKVVVKAED
jgi:HSP20 family protein